VSTNRFAGLFVLAGVLLLCGVSSARAQAQTDTQTQGTVPAQPPAAVARNATPPADLPTGVPLPPDYLIGIDDVLTVFFWREKDLTGDVTVRPDGRITIPLLNDITAVGLTPDQLRTQVTQLADKFVQDPTVTIVVKQINSRKVFITGQIAKPGPYPLQGPLTVMQLIAMAGGVHEFADQDKITILRVEGGKPLSIPFNYEQVKKRKNLQQNILLKPGDTIIVP
jgi:polysaccharide export outer membrane protein